MVRRSRSKRGAHSPRGKCHETDQHWDTAANRCQECSHICKPFYDRTGYESKPQENLEKSCNKHCPAYTNHLVKTTQSVSIVTLPEDNTDAPTSLPLPPDVNAAGVSTHNSNIWLANLPVIGFLSIIVLLVGLIITIIWIKGRLQPKSERRNKGNATGMPLLSIEEAKKDSDPGEENPQDSLNQHTDVYSSLDDNVGEINCTGNGSSKSMHLPASPKGQQGSVRTSSLETEGPLDNRTFIEMNPIRVPGSSSSSRMLPVIPNRNNGVSVHDSPMSTPHRQQNELNPENQPMLNSSDQFLAGKTVRKSSPKKSDSSGGFASTKTENRPVQVTDAAEEDRDCKHQTIAMSATLPEGANAWSRNSTGDEITHVKTTFPVSQHVSHPVRAE